MAVEGEWEISPIWSFNVGLKSNPKMNANVSHGKQEDEIIWQLTVSVSLSAGQSRIPLDANAT